MTGLGHSRIEYLMVLKYKFRLILQKFLILKLFDLKCRKIYYIFNAEDEVRLSPYEDDKLKRLKFNKFKA